MKMTAVSDWGTGRTMDVAVTNAGAAATTSWSVTFTWPQDIAPWNASRLSYSGGKVTVGNSSWNGALARGAATTFGFTDSSASLPRPTSCTATVNNAPATCTISS